MSRIKSRLTVFFEEPFWVGVFEQETDGVIRAARVVFGAQPTDAEVFEFVLRHADRLRYGPPVEGRLSRATANPKKRRREAARETGQRGIGTTRSRLYSLRVSRTGSKSAKAAAHAVRPNRPEGLRSARKSAAKSTAATDFAQRKAQRKNLCAFCFTLLRCRRPRADADGGRAAHARRSSRTTARRAAQQYLRGAAWSS